MNRSSLWWHFVFQNAFTASQTICYILSFFFFFFPWSNKLHVYFVLCLMLVPQHGKSSLLNREDICNFSLVMDEQDQRKQMEKLRFVEHCYATKTIQVTEEIWEGFTPCQLDFGGCCKITTAAARRRTAERQWHLHIPVNDSRPAADISAFSSTL